MTEGKVIYEPHPVTPERKAELRQKGYRIIDARFKPKDAELRDDDVAKMTITELKSLLDERGIEHPSDARKADLQALAVGHEPHA